MNCNGFVTRRLEHLVRAPFAHRGLHDAGLGAPENSLAAFERALERRCGIELDVRLTRDGQAVVFHDDDLLRLAGRPGRIEEVDAKELSAIRLLGTQQTPPLLESVLRLVSGRVPLYVEIKAGGFPGRLERIVARLLDAYGGPVAVASFSPWSLAWFRLFRPHVPRGQIQRDFAEDALPLWKKDLLVNLRYLPLPRPHFLSLEHTSLPNAAAERFRRRRGPVIAWTVTDRTQRDAALLHADNYVFEGFDPGT